MCSEACWHTWSLWERRHPCLHLPTRPWMPGPAVGRVRRVRQVGRVGRVRRVRQVGPTPRATGRAGCRQGCLRSQGAGPPRNHTEGPFPRLPRLSRFPFSPVRPGTAAEFVYLFRYRALGKWTLRTGWTIRSSTPILPHSHTPTLPYSHTPILLPRGATPGTPLRAKKSPRDWRGGHLLAEPAIMAARPASLSCAFQPRYRCSF